MLLLCLRITKLFLIIKLSSFYNYFSKFSFLAKDTEEKINAAPIIFSFTDFTNLKQFDQLLKKNVGITISFLDR